MAQKQIERGKIEVSGKWKYKSNPILVEKVKMKSWSTTKNYPHNFAIVESFLIKSVSDVWEKIKEGSHNFLFGEFIIFGYG